MFIETSLLRTSWIRKENINVMCIRNRFPIRKFFPTIKSDWLKEMARELGGWDKSPSLSIVFGLSSKTQWLSGLYYADFISFYSPTQLCGGGTTKSNSNELPISVPLSRNRIPRKSLNYQSPYQVFLSYLKSLTLFDNLGLYKNIKINKEHKH